MTGPQVNVAIIGAGPYGLSIAAHLRALKVPFRIFGTPMASWRNHMAQGTSLKSFGFASNLYDPGTTFTLAHYCQEKGLPYSEAVDPVTLETFVAYGMEFQKRFVPNLEQTDITSLARTPQGFTLTTQTGERVSASRVIIATGITYFDNIPPAFANLPEELVTHSSQHTDVSKFSGRSVAVIGAGASAADLAGLLHEAGADVHMVARRDVIDFHEPPLPEPRPLHMRLLMPRSGLGQGWVQRICNDLPLIFHALPAKLRLRAVRRMNGPAPAWFSRDKVVGKVTIHLGTTIKEASKNETGVHLVLNQREGPRELHVDHVIAATGYKVKLQRLNFVDQDLRREMQTLDETPVLSTNFESSIPGLYLVGLAAASSFGPVCRFACGAEFTANRVARHLAATT